MSSYEVSDVSVSGVEVGVALVETAAKIAAGAMAVGVVVAGGALVATGYTIYKAGDIIYQKMLDTHLKAIEENNRKEAAARNRLENAKRVRNEVVEQCEKEIEQLICIKDEKYKEIAIDVCNKLKEICMDASDLDVILLETKNKADLCYVEKLLSEYKEKCSLIGNNFERNTKMEKFIDLVKDVFQGMAANEYGFVHNIEVDNEEKVELCRLNEIVDNLISEFYYYVNKEVERYGKVPLADINRVEAQFVKISQLIEIINKNRSNTKNLRILIDSLDEEISSYKVYSSINDKEQEKFLTLYLAYKESCKMLNEDYMEEVEFDSYDELKNTLQERVAYLELMKQRAKIYEQIGREAYICLAFETELGLLNYSRVDKKKAETMLGRHLTNYKVGDKLSPFYDNGEGEKSRVFEIDGKVGLQLIIHNDGTSTMETVSIGDNSEKIVIETQKKHCKKSKELADALWKKWFIKVDFDEIESPLNVKKTFRCGAEDSVRFIEVNKDKSKERLEKQGKRDVGEMLKEPKLEARGLKSRRENI